MTDKNENANETTGGSVDGKAEVSETRTRVKDPEFIRAWQSSNSVAEVVKKTGIKTAGQRAIKFAKATKDTRYRPENHAEGWWCPYHRRKRSGVETRS